MSKDTIGLPTSELDITRQHPLIAILNGTAASYKKGDDFIIPLFVIFFDSILDYLAVTIAVNKEYSIIMCF
jgi:hypothetical protein